MMKDGIPNYWKGNLADVTNMISTVKKGTVSQLCKSAGNRQIYLIHYGEDNDLKRTANFNSACGAMDAKCYADKSSVNYKPTLLLIGTIHGAEFEGTVAVNNLISIIETGRDISGKAYIDMQEAFLKLNLYIIPCINPDGRSRVPFDSIVGLPLETMRKYNQGTWKSGELCNWPECKKIHPIKKDCEYLGGYFNDDGINLMHDDFFNPMAEETKALLKLAAKIAPDLSVMLHGGANCRNLIIKPPYSPSYVYEEIDKLENIWKEKCDNNKLRYRLRNRENESTYPPVSFNLSSALTHVCGAPCITYETNQGLDYGDEICSYDEIYLHHILLFESIAKYLNLIKYNK